MLKPVKNRCAEQVETHKTTEEEEKRLAKLTGDTRKIAKRYGFREANSK